MKYSKNILYCTVLGYTSEMEDMNVFLKRNTAGISLDERCGGIKLVQTQKPPPRGLTTIALEGAM